MGRRSSAVVNASLIALLFSSFVARTARADDDSQLRGVRLGFLPALGVGVAGFTGHTPFASFVATSVSQIDFFVDTGRWGVFVRGAYLSSGNAGLWTAPVGAAGATYRFHGDGEERWGIVGRAGLLYQRWRASQAPGCNVSYFIPESCPEFVAPPSTTSYGVVVPASSTLVDNVGLLAGAAFEIPVEPVYLAIGAEVSTTVDVDHAAPGVVFAGQLTFAFALRDHAHDRVNAHNPRMRHRLE